MSHLLAGKKLLGFLTTCCFLAEAGAWAVHAIMLLIKDDVAAAQLYHSLRSPRWYHWPLICLAEIGLFALPFPGVTRCSDGSDPTAPVEDAPGQAGAWLGVVVLKMVLIGAFPPVVLP